MGPSRPTTTPYRDEKSTLAWRLEKLHIELENVRRARSEIEALAARETELLAEITQLTAEIKKIRAQRSLPLLDLAYVASPCSADWNKMRGNERTRFCEDCGKNVHNISTMSFDDAETFLRSLTGSECIRMYRRTDGTVLTQDCPVGARRKRRKQAIAILVGSGMAVAGFATASTDSDDVPKLSRMEEPIWHAEFIEEPHEGAFAMGGPWPIEPNLDLPELPVGAAGATQNGKNLPIPWTRQMTRPTLVAGASTLVNSNGIEGLMIAKCTLTKNGILRDCQIIAGPASLKLQALGMLSSQRYTPVFYKGKPVDVTYTVKVKLERSPALPRPVLMESPPAPVVHTDIHHSIRF